MKCGVHIQTELLPVIIIPGKIIIESAYSQANVKKAFTEQKDCGITEQKDKNGSFPNGFHIHYYNGVLW